jgi:hypothetical protein
MPRGARSSWQDSRRVDLHVNWAISQREGSRLATYGPDRSFSLSHRSCGAITLAPRARLEAGAKSDAVAVKEGTMDQSSELDERLDDFVTEAAGVGWHATVAQRTGPSGVCLRIEYRSPRPGAIALQVLEICRPNFADAARSARKHIFGRYPG